MTPWSSTLDRPLSPAALAWYGNAAKMRIIELIGTSDGPKTVIDYGAGEGQGWSQVLHHHRDIDLICFEPDPARVKQLRNDVPSARIYDGDPAAIAEAADFIVSFSVFEHVYDRSAYLHHARRLLKAGGTMFLNYDDGHFRRPGSRAEALRNRLAPLLPPLGLIGHYQSRVRREDSDRLVAAAGFAIVEARYENMLSLKTLAKTIPEQDRAAFAQFWLDIEGRLNADFAVEGPDYLGDGTNLWREMGSRTLELRAA